MGAAGALEAVVSLHLAESGRVPPVANFTGGPDADLIDVVTQVRSIAPSYALSNSFGFGGHNVSLILAPPAT
jgi:3-oxoacyl-[acyl-carrier-protein] synthase II